MAYIHIEERIAHTNRESFYSGVTEHPIPYFICFSIKMTPKPSSEQRKKKQCSVHIDIASSNNSNNKSSSNRIGGPRNTVGARVPSVPNNSIEFDSSLFAADVVALFPVVSSVHSLLAQPTLHISVFYVRTAYDCCRCCNRASPMATIAVMAIAWLPLLLEFISGAAFHIYM